MEGNTPCYNGNISSLTWQSGNETSPRGYRFTYDGLSRIGNAMYGEGSNLASNPNRFDEQISGYDKLGNILGLKRYGQISADSYGLIDDLVLSYSGNQLQSVQDHASASVYGNGMEFKDGANQSIEYAYDKNGNVTKDLNKNISTIDYNLLNLPSKVSFVDGKSIEYEYGADGNKLLTVHKTGSVSVTTAYCGNAIYKDGELKMLLHTSGYVSFPDKTFHFYLKDHQGNVRVVADKDGNVEETNTYYPFGGTFTSTASVQPYKYNGKELDRKGGLDWYDYGARYYDTMIGRWCVVDVLSEKYYDFSPYNYCSNNFVGRIDPDGKRDRRVGPNETVGVEHRGGAVGQVQAVTRRVENSTVIVGKVNEYYYNKTVAAKEVTINIMGEMRKNNNLIADVRVTVDASFVNVNAPIPVESYDAVAGGFGNGAPENGNYTVSNYRDRSLTGWYNKGMNKEGVGFSFDLNPQFSTGRTALRIHPDGNNEGTLGCIGLTGNVEILTSFVDVLKSTLKNQTSIFTTINILNNPNNNGRNRKKIPDVDE